jgi:hypothetical protein
MFFSTHRSLLAVGLLVVGIAFAGIGCSQSPDADWNLDGGPTDTMDAGDADTNYSCDAVCNPCPTLGCDCAPCTANGAVCPEPDTVPDGGFPSCGPDAF